MQFEIDEENTQRLVALIRTFRNGDMEGHFRLLREKQEDRNYYLLFAFINNLLEASYFIDPDSEHQYTVDEILDKFLTGA